VQPRTVDANGGALSKLWKLPLALFAALALLVLTSGTASAADDPISRTVQCATSLLNGGCPPPPAELPAVGGPTTDEPTAAEATEATEATDPGNPVSDVLDDVPGGLTEVLPGDIPIELPGDEGTDPGTDGTDPGTTDDEPAAGGLLLTACENFPELPEIPGVGSLTDITCEQLPAAVCPQLLGHPEVPGLAELATALLCAEPAAGPTPAPAQPTEIHYVDCADARARGAAPVHAGQPGYRPGLDSDGDGIGCEDESTGAPVVPVSAGVVPITPAASGQLAYTGFELSPVLATAAALLALGAGLLRTARRRS
jgi:hypothetical protein